MRAVRATSLERRRKGAWKSRSAEREKWRVEGESGRGCCGGTAHENFYDFYALAPAHLEIRFNSLNFKKLPLLSLAPSVDRGS